MDALVSGLALVSTILAQSASRASDTLFSGRMVEAGQTYGIEILRAADLDRDGDLDLITATRTPSIAVSVLLGDGRGGLRWVSTSSGPPSQSGLEHVTELAVLDVDGDGVLDVVSSGLPTKLLVFRGDGSGGLLPPSELTLPGAPLELSSVDMDGDGMLDLVTRIDRYVAVLLRQPVGGFAPAALYSLGPGTEARELEVGDVDGDGAPDVLSIVSTSARLLRNAGDGTLLTAEEVHGVAPAEWIALDDFDADGLLDLVAAWPYGFKSSSISLYAGDGRGAFAFKARRSVEGFGPLWVSDLIDGGPREITMWLEGGLQILSMNSAGIELHEPMHPGSSIFTLADLDEDGHQDLIERRDLENLTPAVAAHFGTGAGTLKGVVVSGEGFESWLEAFHDMDGDGELDALGFKDGLVQVAPGAGEGSFLPAHSARAPGPVNGLFPGDFNGDGIADLMVMVNSLYSVSLFEGVGDFSFRPAQTLPMPTAAGFPYAVLPSVVGDFDRDGRQELAIHLPNRQSAAIVGVDPAGNLAIQAVLHTPGSVGPVLARDLDGNDLLDVLYLRCHRIDGMSLWAFQSNGAGGFEPPRHVLDLPMPWLPSSSFAPEPTWVNLGDLDADGRLDVVARRSIWQPVPAKPPVVCELAAWRQTGAGTWEAVVDQRILGALYGPGPIDLDGDGRMELAFGLLGESACLTVWPGENGGFPHEPDRYAVSAPRFADVDGDGRPDAITSTGTRLAAFLNRSLSGP